MADTTVQPSLFIYTPLPGVNYTRMFILYPGGPNDVVQGRMEDVEREKSRDTYDAISYVWGKPEASQIIICDGHRLPVTPNLADCLRHFRLEDKNRTVWIDGICIDQQNLPEKGLQVREMGKVYAFATQTLVWLGQDTKSIAKESFELIHDTISLLAEQFHKHGTWSFPKLPTANQICADKAKWKRVGELFHLPWFDRTWVIQESGFAKNCILSWGSENMNYGALIELCWWLSWRGDLFAHPPNVNEGRVCDNFAQIQVSFSSSKSWGHGLPFVHYLAGKYRSRALFTSILDTAREVNATDGRDHVYAFLGHPCAHKEDDQCIILPDYAKDISEVYMETALALLNIPKEAEWLLTRVIHRTTQDVSQGKFPSWVARWDNGWFQHPIGGPLYAYCAGGPLSTFKHEFKPDDKALLLHGFPIGTIHWTSFLLERDHFRLDPSKWPQDLHVTPHAPIDILWDNVKTSSNWSVKELDKLEHTFSMSVAAGYSRITDLDTNVHKDCYLAYLDLVRANLRKFRQLPPKEQETQVSAADPFDFYFRTRHSHNRRLAVTGNQYLGLVDGLCEPGDICYLFQGLPTPFILRPAAESGRFHLVGACYFEDLMDGKLFQDLQTKTNLRTENVLLI